MGKYLIPQNKYQGWPAWLRLACLDTAIGLRDSMRLGYLGYLGYQGTVRPYPTKREKGKSSTQKYLEGRVSGCFQKYGKTPKSSILIGFSIIFTIHSGGFPPIFGNIHLLVPRRVLLRPCSEDSPLPFCFFCPLRSSFFRQVAHPPD